MGANHTETIPKLYYFWALGTEFTGYRVKGESKGSETGLGCTESTGLQVGRIRKIRFAG